MVITVRLSPDLEEQLRQCAARGDVATLRQMLVQAVAEQIEDLLESSANTATTLEEYDAAVAELDREMDEIVRESGTELPVLPEEAITRQGIYGEHP